MPHKDPTVARVSPPSVLLEPCTPETVELVTNADMAKGLVLAYKALALCNNDKAALRSWSAEASKQ